MLGLERLQPSILCRLSPLFAAAALFVVTGGAAAQTAAGASRGHCARGTFALAAASAPRTYDDVIEETRGPDICAGNLLTNDNRSITAAIHMHNRSSFLANETYSVYLDTDRDPATGSNGAEYVVSVSRDASSIQRFNGTAFEPIAADVDTEWIEDYGPLIQFPRSAVVADGFDFFFEAKGQETDRAPDADSWTYELQPLRLRARGLSLSRPKAGDRFVASVRVIRSDWDIELHEGRVVCAATLGQARLAGRGMFRQGRSICTWRLPRNARGKLLSGSVGAVFQGVPTKAAFAVRVRR